MKYLVDQKTKEHRPYYGGSLEWAEDQGLDIVRADSEGWIAHTGGVCPLPDDARCEYRMRDGAIAKVIGRACRLRWTYGRGDLNADIVAYRPILEPGKAQERAEKEAERKHMEIKEAEHKRMMLLDRLKAAHEAVQTIPDLEAELREVLGGMGYRLDKLGPFVEPESEADSDMSDWRNWREGDLLLCVEGNGWEGFSTGMVCYVTGFFLGGIEIDKINVLWLNIDDFRFHSRPAKGG